MLSTAAVLVSAVIYCAFVESKHAQFAVSGYFFDMMLEEEKKTTLESLN